MTPSDKDTRTIEVCADSEEGKELLNARLSGDLYEKTWSVVQIILTPWHPHHPFRLTADLVNTKFPEIK